MLKKLFSHTFEEHKNLVDTVNHGNMFSNERQKGVDPNGRGSGEKLGGAEGEEILREQKNLFPIKGKTNK